MAQPTSSRPYPLLGAIAYMALGALLTLGVQTLMQSGKAGPAQAQAATPPNLAAFHEAVERGDLEAMRRLISTGPPGSLDINAPIASDQPHRQGFTPLIAAVFEGNLQTVKALLDAKAKTELRAADGRTALVYAAGWGDAGKVRALLDAGARTDARVGAIEKMQMLLDAGASAALTDQEGNTALSIAASSEVDAQVLATLLKAGAPVNESDRDGVTALMKAAERGDVEQVKVLLAAGAKRDLRDLSNKWTAKEWAAKRDDDKGRAVMALLDGK